MSTLSNAARERFAEYAGKAPHEPAATRFEALQRRHAAWQFAQFGVHPPTSFVLGAVEEICDELMMALQRKSHAHIVDACADALIFATGLCTVLRLDFGTLVEHALRRPKQPHSDRYLVFLVGRLAHLTLKNLQRIRGIDDDTYREGVAECVSEMWDRLAAVARENAFDMESAYAETMERVILRDFRADAEKGGER